MIGFDDKASKDIELAAEEAVSNVMNNVLIDYDSIQVYSDFEKAPLAYIQAQDPMRNALRETKAKG